MGEGLREQGMPLLTHREESEELELLEVSLHEVPTLRELLGGCANACSLSRLFAHRLQFAAMEPGLGRS